MPTDGLGDRMKEYERSETSRRLAKDLPIYARIDGRGFSRFTENMKRPYDLRMYKSMEHATKALVRQTHATIGYIQSDEISLGWIPSEHHGIWFDGKTSKMTSVLAGLATAAFIDGLFDHFDDARTRLAKLPHFDARVINMPSESEMANMFLWRNVDAAKNAISMVAGHYYSHRELIGKHSLEKKEMLKKKGVDFESYPEFFKRGTWVRRASIERPLSKLELENIPPQHQPAIDQLVWRSEIRCFDLPKLTTIRNKEDVLFRGEGPTYAT